MNDAGLNWFPGHWLEIAGTVTSLLYIFFSIRQSLWVWPFSIASSLIYMLVFGKASIYANMALQAYFLIMSIYGWYYWLRGGPVGSGLKVRSINRKMLTGCLLSGSLLFIMLFYFLKQTNSPVPLGDSFTAALSILGTWLLARKVLENWLIWIVVDLVSAIMYAGQHLWPTAGLYSVFVILAITGYMQWKKTLIPAS
ncbi:MAG: nicotinamide riboside transporter PnuC [Bacteroidales bacterium]